MTKHFIALAGNPNCGKSTAFNHYTHSRQSVGNYPGVTVEKKEGFATLDAHKIRLVDLPGTYSLSAYSQEEVIARRVLAQERPGAVINMVNASVLERNVYLTIQLLEMGLPVVVALNMIDEAAAQGISIDTERLESLLGVRVVPTVARTGKGLDEALRAALDLSEGHTPVMSALCISYGPDIDAALLEMLPIIEKHALLTEHYPARWVALKYLEQDSDIMAAGCIAAPEADAALRAVAVKTARHIRDTLNTTPDAVITDYRYGYIAALLRQGVRSEADTARQRVALSDAADRVLTHAFFGPVILLLVLYGMYWLTFTLGVYPKEWLASGIGLLSDFVGNFLPEGKMRSLVTDGIIGGVGGVLSFVPLIAIMFFCICALEDSGYMARAAYMMDRIFRAFGLHGASVMPYILSGGIAGGCAIPGILATRTLRSPKERLATILTLPFMACGAKLPVFLLFVGIFFEAHQALIMFLLTLTGWLVALLSAKILRSTIITGRGTPFVMELPPYRCPTLFGMCLHTGERIWEYIKKAGTTILAIAVLVWAAMTFPGLPEDRQTHFAKSQAALYNDAMLTAQGRESHLAALTLQEKQEVLKTSFAGRLGSSLEPVTLWAGFDWRTDIALIAGIAAKEVIVATFGTIYALEVEPGPSGRGASLAQAIRTDTHWNTANAVALLLFTLLYSPCFPALAVMRHETGKRRWVLFSFLYNLVVAFAVAVVAYQVLTPCNG